MLEVVTLNGEDFTVGSAEETVDAMDAMDAITH